MVKKLMFSMLLVTVIVGGFALVGVPTTHASTGYSYSAPACGYGGCSGYNYSVAMYPYMPVNLNNITPPAASWSAITGCGENGCNSAWGTVTQSYSGYTPYVYYNPRPVYPSYYGW